MNGPLLRLEGVTVRYGGLLALDEVSLHVDEQEILGLIGPNGAGKSTAFNVIAGTVTPATGTVRFGDRDVHGRPPARLAQDGIARTFQHVRLFASMTVLDNVTVGAALRHRSRRAARHRALAALAEVDMVDAAHRIAGSLPLGHQKLVAIARCVAGDPRLLLLDEMMSGLSDDEIDRMVAVLGRLRRGGLTLVIIEHIMEVIDRLTDRVVVFSGGRVLAEGTSSEVQRHPVVRATYLGEDDA
jgi:branched-chain amino acid transport system ATP-binding protein